MLVHADFLTLHGVVIVDFTLSIELISLFKEIILVVHGVSKSQLVYFAIE